MKRVKRGGKKLGIGAPRQKKKKNLYNNMSPKRKHNQSHHSFNQSVLFHFQTHSLFSLHPESYVFFNIIFWLQVAFGQWRVPEGDGREESEIVLSLAPFCRSSLGPAASFYQRSQLKLR